MHSLLWSMKEKCPAYRPSFHDPTLTHQQGASCCSQLLFTTISLVTILSSAQVERLCSSGKNWIQSISQHLTNNQHATATTAAGSSRRSCKGRRRGIVAAGTATGTNPLSEAGLCHPVLLESVQSSRKAMQSLRGGMGTVPGSGTGGSRMGDGAAAAFVINISSSSPLRKCQPSLTQQYARARWCAGFVGEKCVCIGMFFEKTRQYQ
jgi:hypothetical protein